MSKPVLGLTVGAILDSLAGLRPGFSPEARPLMLTIVLGSTVKGRATAESKLKKPMSSWVFEIAERGKEFEIYSRSRLTRVQ